MNDQLHERLLGERNRLKLTQDQMAKAGGVAKRTYCNYETGDREPPASFIAAVKEVGVDVGYLLFGVTAFDTLGATPSEERLLKLYRQLAESDKHTLEAMALTLAQPELASTLLKIATTAIDEERVASGDRYESSKQVFKGSVGDVAGRDIVKKGRGRTE